ncbi:iron permease [Mycena maculata]|uniref:Iron permease n=1 Tax=Mycena maculata TaxID=230809 RepID=A0AAD7HQZ4_9AGAR|nr:iron permease [Mycena maculata]
MIEFTPVLGPGNPVGRLTQARLDATQGLLDMPQRGSQKTRQKSFSSFLFIPPAMMTTNSSPDSGQPKFAARSCAFWMCIIAIMVSQLLSALDLTAVGSGYALSSTAFIPLSGNLADVFGSISLFAVGSALAGASQNMAMMIGARISNSGVGGGGIITLTQIITADLVPLAERGLYQGLLGLVWCLASFIGPPIGGALSSDGTKAWRWLFYLNLPVSGVAFLLVVRALKFSKVDWVGNFIAIVGSGFSILGLTCGGIRYSWASAEVLAPLIVGLSLLVVFGVYQAKCSSSFGTSPIRSAVDFLPGSLFTTPFALFGAVSVSIFKKYRIVNWIGWTMSVIGYGLISTIREDTSIGNWVGYQIVAATGVGLIFSAPLFPLLPPLPRNRAASALALLSFTRSFAQKNLPAEFVAKFQPGAEIAYAAIPVIRKLDGPLQDEVRAAFADSMAVIWQTMIGIAGLGMFETTVLIPIRTLLSGHSP